MFLGLLLNLLDALSYGYILFPLGAPIFSHTGPDGISIFFVSCIVSQLCYSLGLSAFRGGVGSEMIEVVPFFHNMAYSIMDRMEGEPPEAVIATTIVAYCLSSILTGLIFLALGRLQTRQFGQLLPAAYSHWMYWWCWLLSCSHWHRSVGTTRRQLQLRSAHFAKALLLGHLVSVDTPSLSCHHDNGPVQSGQEPLSKTLRSPSFLHCCLCYILHSC